VEVAALCELDAAYRETFAREQGIPETFEAFEPMLEHVDAVVIGTPMQLHAPQAILALDAGKHVLSEVTACVSLEECHQIYAAARRSRGRYSMAENYCYFEDNILVRQLVEQGLFGEIYFGEGEYIHDVRFLHHNVDGTPTWRAQWQVGVPGNTYITHELGPVMQWFRTQNPSDRIETVSCWGSGIWTDPEHPHDDTSLTLLKLTSGKLIKARLDMMSNHPGMSFYSLQGITGSYEGERGGNPARIWFGPNESVAWGMKHREWTPLSGYRDRLSTDWQARIAEARGAGHGGGDYHTARLFAEAILQEKPFDITLEDSLEWTAAGLCSQDSIRQGGMPVTVPRFGA
jgi:predicted dehydrogenase